MSAFVKSIEKVQATFDTTAGATFQTVNLSKGQNYAKCVPFYTSRATALGSDLRQNDWFGLEMIDNSGTPAVKVRRKASATVSERVVEIFVWEMRSDITVHQLQGTLTGTTVGITIPAAIVLANSFCHFTQVMSSTAGSDGFDDTMIQARFGSTTSVDFDRRAAGDPDWDIYCYVVEGDGTDFTTEYITVEFTSTETGPTGHTIATVDLAKAFLISSYEVGDTDDDLGDSSVNFALTGTTTLTFYRDHGGFTPAAAGTAGVWVVKTSGTEFSVQRKAVDIAAATTTDTDLTTAIDQERAVILSSQHIAGGAWSINDTGSGANVEKQQCSLTFLDNDTVRAEKQTTEAPAGANSRLRLEVVEFELVAGNKLLLLPPGMQEMSGGMG